MGCSPGVTKSPTSLSLFSLSPSFLLSLYRPSFHMTHKEVNFGQVSMKKQRHYFVNKGPSSQGSGFASSLAGRIPGMGTLVGCRLWGRTESDTTEAT